MTARVDPYKKPREQETGLPLHFAPLIIAYLVTTADKLNENPAVLVRVILIITRTRVTPTRACYASLATKESQVVLLESTCNTIAGID